MVEDDDDVRLRYAAAPTIDKPAVRFQASRQMRRRLSGGGAIESGWYFTELFDLAVLAGEL